MVSAEKEFPASLPHPGVRASSSSDLLSLIPSPNESLCAISAVVPAWQRVTELLKTIRQIQACRPAPAEILVHVDGATPAVLEALRQHHPDIRVLTSETLLGPGGSRNRLIAEARHELVANFDDDSFPDQPDYFERIMQTAALFPDAAMISAASQDFEKQMPGITSSPWPRAAAACFAKAGFNARAALCRCPWPTAWRRWTSACNCMPWAGVIIHDPGLHVKHDKLPPTEVNAELNARVIANFALLPYLRYPRLFWPVGLWQVLRRCFYTVTHGWTAGTLTRPSNDSRSSAVASSLCRASQVWPHAVLAAAAVVTAGGRSWRGVLTRQTVASGQSGAGRHLIIS
jgi:glycosyltransferase involved in cell wall biosynthesis